MSELLTDREMVTGICKKMITVGSLEKDASEAIVRNGGYMVTLATNIILVCIPNVRCLRVGSACTYELSDGTFVRYQHKLSVKEQKLWMTDSIIPK